MGSDLSTHGATVGRTAAAFDLPQPGAMESGSYRHDISSGGWARALKWFRFGLNLALVAQAVGFARSKMRRRGRARVPSALLALAGVSALDVLTRGYVERRRGRAVSGASGGPVSLRSVVTIGRPPEDVYRAWRDLPQLARFMSNVEAVEVLDQLRSAWRVRVAGKLVEWKAEIMEDRANEVIAWRTLEQTFVSHAGEVRFLPAPGGRGTEVHVRVDLQSPGGVAGQLVAKLGRKLPQQQITNDLRRFKQMVEVGELIRSDAGSERPIRGAR
jgi:uncharacterized membrane protein